MKCPYQKIITKETIGETQIKKITFGECNEYECPAYCGNYNCMLVMNKAEKL